jgi:hypothetical protein
MFMNVIRKQIDLGQEKGLYIFVNGVVPPTGKAICDGWFVRLFFLARAGGRAGGRLFTRSLIFFVCFGRSYVKSTDISLSHTGQLMSEIYGKHKEEDGFLYVLYAAENTYGAL